MVSVDRLDFIKIPFWILNTNLVYRESNTYRNGIGEMKKTER